MKFPAHFDDSLPVFAALVLREWGQTALFENLFLRDATGRLTFVVLGNDFSTEDRALLASKAVTALGHYVDSEGFAVATPDELFDDRLKGLAGSQKIRIG